MIKELLQKLAGAGRRNDGFIPDKVSPDEVELSNYMEHERKERIKKMLIYYRKKKEYEHWHSRKILQDSMAKPLHSGSIILKEGR
jgi:hypothetical protein